MVDNSEEKKPELSFDIDRWLKWLKENGFKAFGIPFLAFVASCLLTGNAWVVWRCIVLPAWNFALRVVGTALGISFGIGMATHVHEHLEAISGRGIADSYSGKRQERSPLAAPLRKSGSMGNNWADGETAYSSLMTSAGYDVTDHILRGQIVKPDSKFFGKYYPFTEEPNPLLWRAVKEMKEHWPTLPPSVSEELGKFMEYLTRDFIASWYHYVDTGVVYEDERLKRKRLAAEANDDATTNAERTKAMVFSTAKHRPAPMMTAMYQSMGIIFGNLCTRVEGVNLFSLALIKWVKVLSHTFRVYRKLRQDAAMKQRLAANRGSSTPKGVSSSLRSDASVRTPTTIEPASEMAVTREFMLKGKLHRALTFGMDVPALLFGDSKGEECGSGTDEQMEFTEDSVLEERLFGAKMLYECEMDYNRVLGSRLVRALLPRSEFTSPIIRTMMTEMMAGCVLTPVMSCMCPEYINGWILMGCAESPTQVGTENGESNNQNEEPDMVEEPLMRGWDSAAEPTRKDLPQEEEEELDVLTDLQQTPSSVEAGVEMTMSQANLIETELPKTDLVRTMGQTEFFKSNSDVVLDDEDEGIDGLEEHNSDGKLDYAGHDSFKNDDEERTNPDKSSLRDEEATNKEQAAEQTILPSADFVLPLLTMSLIDLQRFVDFQECRDAHAQNKKVDVVWDDPAIQESISQLVLVIEATLIHGRREPKLKPDLKEDSTDDEDQIDDSEKGVEVILPAAPMPLFLKTLMEITNDPDAFEEKILQEEEDHMQEDLREETNDAIVVCPPTASDLATLRSLVSSWLQSGQAHRMMSVLTNAEHSCLKPFFHKHAFMRTKDNVEGFVRQLRMLNGVNILLDTMIVLSSPCMDVNEDGATVVPKPDSGNAQGGLLTSATVGLRSSLAAERGDSTRSRKSTRFALMGSTASPTETEEEKSENIGPPSMTLPQAYVSSTGLPRFLDFRRNDNFSSSLRAERDRRMQSWANATTDSGSLQIICSSKGSTESSVTAHREMHQISRIFYAGTNIIALRNGARRKDVPDSESANTSDPADVESLSLLTIEMACQRRRLEVPDDDSSFLLRAQPRPLSAVGVHRDQRNHDMSFKCFAATFEEPALCPGQTKYTGGRYVRKCLLRYFPNDRTCQVVVPNEARNLDQRKEKAVPSCINVGRTAAPFLSGDFLRERHLSQKWAPKGATPRSGSILASSVMEVSDFNAVPRTGKAIDFVYRLSLFERPMVDLSGKLFTICDSASMGTHRADASSLEMSDAAISVALLTVGNDWDEDPDGKTADDEDEGKQPDIASRRSSVEMGSDGYPIVWLKYTRKQGENNITEVKSYRASYIRAALLLTSARQEAQLKCLIKCVQAGSARSATKQRTEAYLRPVSKLLEYANSTERDKQSILLRDLKLGMNHIDIGQLRRNGLLSPRFPTVLHGLVASCEGAAQVKDTSALAITGMTVTMYKIRCSAVISIVDSELEDEEIASYLPSDQSKPKYYREEWVIYRPMKDIQALHKHLKTQVATAEQSASAGARLVGAATAAFAVTSGPGSHRRRKALIPSLGQAQKTGLVTTRKAIQKRCGILNGYFHHFLASDHPLNRSPELLMFLGAFYPFPSDVKTGSDPLTNKTDPLGRMEMKRVVFESVLESALDKPISSTGDAEEAESGTSVRSLGDDGSVATAQTEVTNDASVAASIKSSSVSGSTRSLKIEAEGVANRRDSMDTESERAEKAAKLHEMNMIPAIKAKIDEVPLVQVRAALFELIRFQFDFDNANFFRNRIFSTLKTMSIAVTTSGEFRKMLYDAHLKYINADELAGWIKFTVEMLWPEGMFYEASPPTTDEDLEKLMQDAKKALPAAFPDQLRSVFGQEIVEEGLDMLFEMLQNRVVLKSMSYMLFDLLWLEIFPELHDILTGGEALESDL